MGPGLMGGLGKPLAKPVVEEADDLETVSADLIAAVKAGDAAGVSEALRAAYAVCGNDKDVV